MPDREKTDALVIGTGLAGLSFALTFAPYGRVCVIAKRAPDETNTSRAQGGIAAACDPLDTVEAHVKDTLRAGSGLCHEDVVRMICREGPVAIRQLQQWGIGFAAAADGIALDLTKEGGHSARRIAHAKDATGRSIEAAMLATASAHPNITILDGHVAVDLISTRTGRPSAPEVLGAYVLDSRTGKVVTIGADVTCLATGGAGKVYLYTTNPDIASGDGIAMAYRAGARIANLEFVQFHPTCLFHPQAKAFLISEALRGEGGMLRLITGERFMDRYDPRGELATRDIVARAIDAELKHRGHEYVLLDISHKPAAFVTERFPTIHATCLQYGIDITRQPIPVVPAAHYQCGGVMTDTEGRTTLPRLFACGEVAHTGLHGANRLASNALLEATVMGIRAAGAAVQERMARGDATSRDTVPAWDTVGTSDSDESVVITHNWDEVRRTMWNYVGIVRTDKRLARALARVTHLQEEIRDYYWNFTVTGDLIELRNLALVAELIIRCAQARKESRGLHYMLDYPGEDAEFARDTIVERTFRA
ncbi:MAG: L-aspartate oxidase [Deltaproteobacteria bacterium]|nr:L-aspartate oxidase [Deltaproteobacteria bacterium]